VDSTAPVETTEPAELGKQEAEAAAATPPSLLAEIRAHLALDWPLAAILAVYCVLVLPLVPRWTDNVAKLAAYSNDEPFISQQLDGMTVWPYGNPSNFLERKNAGRIPSYWMNYRYYDLIYYGGTYLDLGFVVYAPLKAAGLPAFPTGPIVLRTISFLAGLISLMIFYNFGRRYIGWFAGAFAATAVMFESNFMFMATTIHPDMLQLALTLVALVIVVRHARLGDMRSLIAFGVLSGVIQGTKSGSLYLVPLAVAAVLMGVWSRAAAEPGFGKLRRRLVVSTGRLAVVGAAAVAGFVVSTPFMLVDDYYFRTQQGAYHVLTGTSPLIPISFFTWYRVIVQTLGWPLVLALLAGVAWFLVQSIRLRRFDRPLTLALVLSAGNVLWYTGVGRFWVVLYYLLAALGLLSVFAGGLIAALGTRLKALGRPGAYAQGVLMAAVLVSLSLVAGRPEKAAVAWAAGVNPGSTPQVKLATWADHHVPGRASILFDDEAYFDPARFPTQATNAGVLRYVDVMAKRPDYFVLTDYPPDANWIMVKRKTQRFGRWNPDPYSVRLYQDLIDGNRSRYTPGPTPVPHIQLVKVAGLPREDKVGQPRWFTAFDDAYRLLKPSYQGVQAWLSGTHRLLLYRVDSGFYEANSAKAR
jgi:hypothetical protein